MQDLERELNKIISNSELYYFKKNSILKKIYIFTYVVLIIIGFVSTIFIIPTMRYNTALNHMNIKQYNQAMKEFDEINWFKDSKEKSAECLYHIQKETFRDVKIGNIVKWGLCEQDNNKGNGKEEIEWLVLDIIDDKVLVISLYVIAAMDFNVEDNMKWEDSIIRTFLNGKFYKSSFSSVHKKNIILSKVISEENRYYETKVGNDTEDYLFLLSLNQALDYFENDENRKAKYTQYAKEDLYRYGCSEGYSWWWLRTPGYARLVGTGVTYSGEINSRGITYYGQRTGISTHDFKQRCNGVRPAMWINLE